MGISASFQTASVLDVMGEMVEFPRLDIFDLSLISEVIKSNRKDIARRNSKETNLTQQELFNVLSSIDVRDITVGEIIDYCVTPNGAKDIVRRSLQKKNWDEAKIKETIVGLSSADLVLLAQQLVVYSPKKAEESKETDSKNAVKEVSTPTVTTSETSTTSTPTSTVVHGVTIPPTYGN